jgi:23S rRNA (pseudouridine1915-N3)-methyltransferase
MTRAHLQIDQLRLMAEEFPDEVGYSDASSGKSLTFAAWERESNAVARWLAGGKDVALLVGGSDGLSAAVLERAGERLALSRMTLPHRLARLVLVEQLYRAMTILRGEPYHK